MYQGNSLEHDITIVLNHHFNKNYGCTPDFILAELITDTLNTWDKLIRKRDEWYQVCLCPGYKCFYENTKDKQEKEKTGQQENKNETKL